MNQALSLLNPLSKLPQWPALSHPNVGIAACAAGSLLVVVSQVLAPWIRLLYRVVMLILGMLLVITFALHTAFYVGHRCIAWDATSLRKGNQAWERNSKSWIEKTLGLEIVNEQQYNRNGKKPVIYVMNRLPATQFQNMCLLACMRNQGPFRLVTYATTRSSTVHTILSQQSLIVIPHGGHAYEEFMQKCKQALLEGESILVFPEGKYAHSIDVADMPLRDSPARDHDSSGPLNASTHVSGNASAGRLRPHQDWTMLNPFQTGVFDLAFQTHVPIVPLILEGTRCPKGIIWDRTSTSPVKLHMLHPIRVTHDSQGSGKTQGDEQKEQEREQEHDDEIPYVLKKRVGIKPNSIPSKEVLKQQVFKVMQATLDHCRTAGSRAEQR